MTGLVEFARVGGGTDGPEYRAVTASGTYRVRREATTHSYPRGASNPMYRVYLDDRRLDPKFRYLAEAQQYVRRQAEGGLVRAQHGIEVLETPDTLDEN